MTSQRHLKDAQAIKSLAERLSVSRAVTKFDTDEEKEAWTLAHALSDLEESFRRFLDVQLPTLVRGQLSEDGVTSTLLDIGEEFRHILYHIRDPRFFRYLENVDDPATNE